MSSQPEDSGPSEIEELRRRVADLEAELESLRAQHRIEREHDRLRHQDHALGLHAELETARDKNRLVGKRVTRLRERLEEAADSRTRDKTARAELDAVYASRTWRAGRVVARSLRGRRP